MQQESLIPELSAEKNNGGLEGMFKTYTDKIALARDINPDWLFLQLIETSFRPDAVTKY